MEKLTPKEEEVLYMIYDLGHPCAPKDVRARYEEPRPNINAVANMFQSLEKKGYLGHRTAGRGFLYFPLVPREDFGESKIGQLVARCFEGSYLNVVNRFVRESNVSREDLLRLLDELEKKQPQQEGED
ncbi:MAG: BlaI/MecI/CopY family transcriptional regulator [Alloprevotella sp.]|nr:BlaI/MecI/CopY family transcriptional regulator [Alloprevotella sp.]